MGHSPGGKKNTSDAPPVNFDTYSKHSFKMTDYSLATSIEDAVPINSNEATIRSIQAHKGTTLSWKSIEYTVTIKEKDKEITKTLLHPMSGEACSGELLAVMGTSGAGKSTLLDVLAGRLVTKDVKGTVLTNNSPVDLNSFRKESGYVMQSDALFPLLTVRETFRFAAYLRIANKTIQQKHEIVETIISLLRLEKVADTIIGDDENRGLSGGEKRRVSIGVDIVHFPSIIFLDEPTSGLDSHTALSVVESLKSLAQIVNCTIIMTIHQPSTRLFNLLDKVIFLCSGYVTYNGSVSDLYPHTMTIYKDAALGDAPISANPPEVWLDLSDLLQEKNELSRLTSSYSKLVEDNLNVTMSPQSSSSLHVISYANSYFNEIGILCDRALTNIMRTKELFFARLGATIGFGVMIGTLYLNTEDNSKGISHRSSYFVFTIAFYYWTSLEALPIFLAEREIFQREFSRGAYRALSYTIANTLITLPFLLVLSFAYNIVTFWLVNINNSPDTFFFQVLIVFTVLVGGSSFATMFSVLVPNPMAGQTIGSGLFSVMFLFSGFFIRGADIPLYWIWLHYLSLFKYALDSLLVNALQDHVSYTAIDSLGVTYNVDNETILRQYDIYGINRGTGVGVIWIFIIFFRIVFCYRLVTIFNGSRK